MTFAIRALLKIAILASLALAFASCTVLNATPLPPTATAAPAPTVPAATLPVVEVTPVTPTAGGATPPPIVSEVLIHMVALEDNGASGMLIGCGDSLIPVRRAVNPTSDPVTAALAELFSVGTQYYGESGFYNALHQSSLQVSSVTYAADGTPTVSINGAVRLGGTCDTPRFERQIVQTILAAAGTENAVVYLNGELIKEALSQQ